MHLVVQFLTSIRGFVLEQNGDELRNWLLVENDVADIYLEMSKQLRANFPPNSPALEKLVDKSLPEEDEVPEGKGSPWPGFNSFIKEYLEYWRDVDFNDIIALHTRLSGLLMYVLSSLIFRTHATNMYMSCPDHVQMPLQIPHMASCCCKPACRSLNRCPSWL